MCLIEGTIADETAIPVPAPSFGVHGIITVQVQQITQRAALSAERCALSGVVISTCVRSPLVMDPSVAAGECQALS